MKHLKLYFLLLLLPSLSYANESDFLGFTKSFSEVHLSCQVSEYVSKVNYRQEYQQKKLELELASGERKILEESKRREKMEYEAAVERRRRHVIRSPIDGVITNVNLHVGELCDNNKIATISDPKKGLFIINVEGFLGENVKKGQKMKISLGEGEKVNVWGTVTYVAPILDASSGLKKIKLVFDNSKLNILPGVSGTLKLN